MKLVLTIAGLVNCVPPEFKPQDYKGLRSGIGKDRKSSKHYQCKGKCCTTPKTK